MNSPPRSAYHEVGGLVYFARMLDKIRLHARGELRKDFHENLGKGFDGRLVGYLGVAYEDLKARVLQGGTDEEVLEWCYTQGKRLDANLIYIWNMYITKAGWNDPATEILERRKKESGLERRDDILTMFAYFDADEGRT